METATEIISISRQEYQELLQAKQQLEVVTHRLNIVSSELEELKRLIFGSTSERFISTLKDGQLDLFENDEKLTDEQVPEQTVDVNYKRHKKPKQKPKRKSLPAHLEREVEIIQPKNLSKDAEKIGEEISERYEYTPAKLYVKQTIRPKYAQPKTAPKNNTSKNEVVQAPMPSHPFPKSNLGISLATHISVSKYVDHLPLHRILQIFKRDHVTISAATIDGWINLVCKVLNPLYSLLLKKIKASQYAQADESTIKVLINKEEKKSRNKKKNQHTGYYWVAHAVLEKLVAFHYYDSRKADCIIDLLGDFQGLLQTDGYAAYDWLGNKEGVLHLTCMAHVRRYFEKAYNAQEKDAAHCMIVIQELYAIERYLQEQSITDIEHIKQYRIEKAKPILETWEKWLRDKKQELSAGIIKQSKLLTAINYTLARWDKVMAYLKDGRALIDNNAIENKIRPLALGRKNYLFAGSHKGAQRGAIMYSFFACCKLNDVNPSEWLNHVLDKIHQIDTTDQEKLNELLPNNFHKIIQDTGMSE